MSFLNTHCVLLALAFPFALCAADPVQQLVDDYFARRPSNVVSSDTTMADARRMQEKFVAALVPQLGKRVGFKVGLVTKEAQEKSGVTSPIRGVLLEKMMLRDHAEVSANFGARPLIEADLMVVVRDRAINNAVSPLDVLRNLKEVVAFIELPDSSIAANERVTGPLLTAVNVGARFGILGQRVPVKADLAFVEALEKMQINLVDGVGTEHGRAAGSIILQHPINAILWLIEDLQTNGDELRPGDLISLGSVKAITPEPGQTYTVKYEGLPGGPISASVKFLK